MLFWVTNDIYQRRNIKFPTSASFKEDAHHHFVKSDLTFKSAQLVTDRFSTLLCCFPFKTKTFPFTS